MHGWSIDKGLNTPRASLVLGGRLLAVFLRGSGFAVGRSGTKVELSTEHYAAPISSLEPRPQVWLMGGHNILCVSWRQGFG